MIKEYRIRYAVPTAAGTTSIHAIICIHLKKWKDKITAAGYKIVGIDERTRKAEHRIPVNAGWNETGGQE